MKVIGLTGKIGSGKSTVARFLKELGAGVIDADDIAHRVYAPGTPGWQRVVDAFGEGILDADGGIDRQRLGDVVFGDPAARARLNGIVHPLVEKKARTLLRGYRHRGFEVAVIEAALLVEAGWRGLLDELWVTTAPREVIYQRLAARDAAARARVRARLQAQLPVSRMRQVATRVISTDTDPDRLRRKVAGLWRKITTGPAGSTGT